MFAKEDAIFIIVHTSMQNDRLSAFVIAQDHDIVLEVKVDAELVRRQVDVEKFACFKRYFLAFDFLK